MSQKLFKPIDLYYAVVWTATRICYSLLPIAMLFRYAALKGFIKSLASRQRALVRDNICLALGNSCSKARIRAAVRQHFEYLEKLGMIFRLPAARLFAHPERWPVEGLTHLESALALGKGVVLVSTHFGYARLTKHILKANRYDLCVVGTETTRTSKSSKRKKDLLNELSVFGRSLYKWLNVPALPGHFADLPIELNVRPILERLKRNEILLIMGDGTRAAKFVTVDFLGKTLAFPTGFASIALATGTPVLPAFVVDTHEGYGIKLIIAEPLAVEGNHGLQRNLETCVHQFARQFESQVRRSPHLYKMFSRENRFERRLARSQSEVSDRYVPGKRRMNEKVSQL